MLYDTSHDGAGSFSVLRTTRSKPIFGWLGERKGLNFFGIFPSCLTWQRGIIQIIRAGDSKGII